ncbi:hypothetical protein [Gemmiger formicilis]|uniref:hypothetical protein n=1 Tax=Gemmiger formicilis TaxID=745368 RepID=UPI00399C3179
MSGIKAKRKQLVRKTLMRAKTQGERAAEQRQELPEEYAQTEVQQGISDVAARTGNTAKSTARISYRKFRAMQEKRKNLTLQGSAQSASKPTEKEKVTVPTQTERREMFKKKRFRQKAIAAKTPAPQAPVPSSATPAPPPYQAQMQQHLKRQHLTREAVRRYLQKQTATTAAGNTAPIVTHAPKLPTISSKQATVEAISRGVHYIAAKIKALLSQTVRHAAQSLLALLGAGGVVLLLAMVIGAAAAVIGSPMGILFADESGDPNSIPIAEIVADTNADFGAAVNDIVSAHPECSETTITYDYEDGHTWASYWPEVLAIFAVHTNLNSDSDVVVINAAQMQRIQDTFWAMHEITYEVEEVDTTPEPTEDDPDPEQQTDYILHITVSSKTVDELAELYNFTQDQKRHFAPAAIRGNAPQPACSVRRDCCCRWRVVLAAAGAHLYILPLRGKWTPSAMPGIAAQIFPHRREHPSWLPTAARCWSAAGTTATAIRCCWITALDFPRGTPI